MAKEWKQGVLSIDRLGYPEKYVGKKKNQIVFRSSWELSFCRYLDRSENIIQWSSEEKIIPYKYSLDKRMHRYFPDFYVKYRAPNGKLKEVIIEIKPLSETMKPVLTSKMKQKKKTYLVESFIKNTDKWVAAKIWCKQRKMNFLLLTERDLVLGGKKPR